MTLSPLTTRIASRPSEPTIEKTPFVPVRQSVGSVEVRIHHPLSAEICDHLWPPPTISPPGVVEPRVVGAGRHELARREASGREDHDSPPVP